MQERGFDAATFDEEEDRQSALDKGKDFASENVIRWRPARGAAAADSAEGAAALESNARIVQWSDGSYQLWVGDESFDISMQKLAEAGEGSALFAVVKDVREEGAVQPDVELHFAAHGLVESKMLVRPSVLNSAVHKELTAAANVEHAKHSKIRRAPAKMEDPEEAKRHRLAMRQKETRNARLASQRSARQSGRSFGRSSSGGLSVAYLEAGDEEEEEEQEYGMGDDQLMSISQVRKDMKRRAGGKKRARADASFIADEDEEEEMVEEEEEEAVSTSGDDNDDDDDVGGDAGGGDGGAAAAGGGRAEPVAKKKRRRVIADDDDSD